MSTLTISSGVYVNDEYTPTTRFSPVSLTNVGVRVREKLYPQAIRGMAAADQPIVFEISRFVRKKIIDDLLPKAATFVARRPRRTLSGTIDAVVNDGAELCKFEWQEVDRRSGATYTQSEYGFFAVVEPNVVGIQESVQLVLYPVDRLRFVQSSTFLSVASTFSMLSYQPVMWFDATDATTLTEIPATGGRISEWRDKSGNDYHVSQANQIQSPFTGTRTINGQNVIDFEGFNDTLVRGGSPIISQPNTTFVVADTDALTSLWFLYDGNGANRQLIGMYGSPPRWLAYAGTLVTGTSAEVGPALFRGVFDGANSVLDVNGVPSHTGVNIGTSSQTGLRMASDSVGSTFFDGGIGEYVFFDRLLTNSETAEIEAYMAGKWGLTIS